MNEPSGIAARDLGGCAAVDASPPPWPSFPVVGIGAAAGSAADFMRALPADSGLAFVLVQEPVSSAERWSAQALAQELRLPVVEADDGMALRPDHLHLVPSGHGMVVTRGVLRAAAREAGCTALLPIDLFMRSLAEDCACRAIGVVLPGTDRDGWSGLAEIRAAGGITFAQAPCCAGSGLAAADAPDQGGADFILPPREIVEGIAALNRQATLDGGDPQADAEAFAGDEVDHLAVLAILSRRSDRDLSPYRASLIKRRIRRRMAVIHRASLRDYAAALASDEREAAALLAEVFTTSTGFFRLSGLFATLRATIIPKLVEGRSGSDAIRVWIVGCSTGQEAYSVAIELSEALAGQGDPPAIQVFATDLDPAALAVARAGCYPDSIEAEVPAERLRRHFTRMGGTYRINKPIRDCCVFARHDLTADMPFSKIDAIVCRGVLDRLASVVRTRAVHTLHYALGPAGWLVLGDGEEIGGPAGLFDAHEGRHRAYMKRRTALRTLPPPPSSQRRLAAVSKGAPASGARADLLADLQRAADRVMLGRYAPSGVLIDERLNIIQFRGKASRFLEPAQGEASLNLMKMVSFALGQELLRGIAEAKRGDGTFRRTGLRLREGARLREIDIEISLVRPQGSAEASILILFEEPASAREAVHDPLAVAQQGDQELKRELAETAEHLQSLIEDQRESAAALRDANDEAISANEELRCANEELQTAKEEIETVNEELATLNEEMRQRNLELSCLNQDLGNLLDAVDMPILMLDGSLRLRRATRPTARSWRLGARDVGRHIGSLDLGLPQGEIERAAGEVMRTGDSAELEVRDRQGRWSSLRITPYRTEDDRIEGIVVTCIDIDAAKRGADILRRSGDFTRSIIETVRDPLLVLDARLRVHTANRAFFRLLGHEPDAVLGRQVQRIGEGQWDIPELGRLLAALFDGAAPMDDFEVTSDFARIGRRALLLNARLLESGMAGDPLIVLAIADITGHKRLVEEVRAVSAELLRSNTELGHFASVASHDLRAPLRSMACYTGLLEQRLAGLLDAECGQFMRFIAGGAARMMGLIDAILGYAQVGSQPLDARVVDANDAARQALHNLELAIGESGVRIDCASLPAVRADPVLLVQLLQNLVANAIKFRTTNRKASVAIAARRSPDGWTFSVADNGIGIQPGQIERIFLLFQRGHALAEYQGNGIGLATCRRIVERHGGRLWVESVPKVGTTFFFTLPAADGAAGDGRTMP